MINRLPYDQSYKLLFSDPLMIKDLLLGFFAEDWVNELAFTTLERLNTAYVTENLRERESDIVWRVRWRDQTLYLLILIEFQSSVDSFMIVRLLSYISLLYQDVIKNDEQIKKSKQLPPILPMIIYNGKEPWNAPLSFDALLASNIPKTLRKFQPSLSCWLLDEGRYIPVLLQFAYFSISCKHGYIPLFIQGKNKFSPVFKGENYISPP